MSGSKGEEALAEYKRALEVMSAKKTAPKKAVLSENDDEVQFIKGNKRQAALALTSSLKKKSKASGSTPRVSLSSSSDPATVLANLNTKVFPLTPVVLPERDSSASIQFIQGDLLQVTRCSLLAFRLFFFFTNDQLVLAGNVPAVPSW